MENKFKKRSVIICPKKYHHQKKAVKQRLRVKELQRTDPGNS
jgi:hypothetical protein